MQFDAIADPKRDLTNYLVMSIVGMVLGLLGIVACQIFAPIGLALCGYATLNTFRMTQSQDGAPPVLGNGEGTLVMVLGGIGSLVSGLGTLLLLLTLVFVVLYVLVLGAAVGMS